MQAAETVTAEVMEGLYPHHFTSTTSLLASSRDDGAGSLVLLRKVSLLFDETVISNAKILLKLVNK